MSNSGGQLIQHYGSQKSQEMNGDPSIIEIAARRLA
jgi:hypothetical protein